MDNVEKRRKNPMERARNCPRGDGPGFQTLEPISKIHPARVARDFPVSARRGEEVVAVATATEPQRSGTGKSPQPAWDMANFRNTGVASDSGCIKHTFVLAPWSCGNWLISRAEVFLRWVLCDIHKPRNYNPA